MALASFNATIPKLGTPPGHSARLEVHLSQRFPTGHNTPLEAVPLDAHSNNLIAGPPPANFTNADWKLVHAGDDVSSKSWSDIYRGMEGCRYLHNMLEDAAVDQKRFAKLNIFGRYLPPDCVGGGDGVLLLERPSAKHLADLIAPATCLTSFKAVSPSTMPVERYEAWEAVYPSLTPGWSLDFQEACRRLGARSSCEAPSERAIRMMWLNSACAGAANFTTLPSNWTNQLCSRWSMTRKSTFSRRRLYTRPAREHKAVSSN